MVGLTESTCGTTTLHFLIFCLISRMFTLHSSLHTVMFTPHNYQPSQSLQTRLTDHPTKPCAHFHGCQYYTPMLKFPWLPGWTYLRGRKIGPAQHQDTRDLDGATPRQRLSSACSPLSTSATCWQDSPQAFTTSAVALSVPTQVTDLLAWFAGVVSTTPAAAWMIPSPRASGMGLLNPEVRHEDLLLEQHTPSQRVELPNSTDDHQPA